MPVLDKPALQSTDIEFLLEQLVAVEPMASVVDAGCNGCNHCADPD
jgi:hypothetical protein